MTSSIPMFIPKIILNDNVYFENCITDSDGFLEKLKNSIFLKNLENCNLSSSDCFDVKLYHSRNNLYKKEIVFEGYEDKKNVYLLNTIKMAFDFTSNFYFKVLNVSDKTKKDFFLYRQDQSSIFDEDMEQVINYKAILFFNDSDFVSPFKITEGEVSREFFPSKGSLIILSPGSSFNMGYLTNDRYYAICNFKADII